MILIAMIVKATTFFTYLLSITNVHIGLYINSSNYACNCSNCCFEHQNKTKAKKFSKHRTETFLLHTLS